MLDNSRSKCTALPNSDYPSGNWVILSWCCWGFPNFFGKYCIRAWNFKLQSALSVTSCLSFLIEHRKAACSLMYVVNNTSISFMVCPFIHGIEPRLFIKSLCKTPAEHDGLSLLLNCSWKLNSSGFETIQVSRRLDVMLLAIEALNTRDEVIMFLLKR